MMTMAARFQNFDDEQVYVQSRERVLLQSSQNFAVEFGKDGAQIAFDLFADDIEVFLRTPAPQERPIRWINIWAPQTQTGVVDYLGHHYRFSPRLLAIIRSSPPHRPVRAQRIVRGRATIHKKDDVERVASDTKPSSPPTSPPTGFEHTSHYTLVKQMMNYQSIDIGPHFLCVGANWMHELESTDQDERKSIVEEGTQQRLWTWLVLCDNHTVISFHEDPGHIANPNHLKSLRANTLSVLSQLSIHDHYPTDPISMQTVRHSLQLDPAQADPGVEGASNLFFYLFDDWRAVYRTVHTFQQRLDSLQREIFDDMTRKSNTSPNIRIIPRLHILGRQIRQMQHLYEGYANLIKRILAPKPATCSGNVADRNTDSLHSRPPSFFGSTAQQLDRPHSSSGVHLSVSASQRFERLSDRIHLLILSETREFLAEKDALISTYFNITAQKDSESTTRLTRSAALLAKLSVLFLPVSLMTSYFSIQIADLEGVYTSRDYWYSFAVLMSVSFGALFFFGRLLMWVTEVLDAWVRRATGRVGDLLLRRRIGRRGMGGSEGSEDEGGDGEGDEFAACGPSVVKVG